MAVLVEQTAPGAAGAALSFVAASAGGDQFPNTGLQWLFVKQGAGARVVTILAVQDPYGRTDALVDEQHTVDPNTIRWFGPFRPLLFNNDESRVAVAYDAVTNTEVAVLRAM